MNEPADPICLKCKHFRDFQGGCDAFPEGIPDKILETNEHSKPLKDQGNDLIFTPKEKK